MHYNGPRWAHKLMVKIALKTATIIIKFIINYIFTKTTIIEYLFELLTTNVEYTLKRNVTYTCLFFV